ncbi:hypothetical protein [Anaplasma bovis]|uniref:hypothetical protein n=1 Tax=Anaplasma bovis TaxID=186733 RepID=UPI002FF0BE0B
MHDSCDLYLKLLDDVDLLFSQYGGSDSYLSKRSTVRNPAYAVKCALNAMSAAIRISKKDCRELNSQLLHTYWGIKDYLGSGTPGLLQEAHTFSILDELYSALKGLTPLIAGQNDKLFDGCLPLCKSRIVIHLEEAVSHIAYAARDIQNRVHRDPKEKKEGDEKYYRHASRAVFTCVNSLLEGCAVSSASTNGCGPLSFSGIRAALRLVLLMSDTTPHEHVATAAQASIMQFEHCIEQLRKARGLGEWAPDDEHRIALSAFKFAVNAWADSKGISIASKEDSVLPHSFVNFHLLEACSYVDYITIKSGNYAHALAAYEEEHENHGIVEKIYDCSGEICDLEGALDTIDTLIGGMLRRNNDAGSSSFYSSPTVRKTIKSIVDNIAILLAKVCTWEEAWSTLQGGTPQPTCGRATALYGVLKKSREDFMASVGCALELFTICMCRLDDVHYSRNMFPQVAAWDSSSLPVFPGEYTRSKGSMLSKVNARSSGGLQSSECRARSTEKQFEVLDRLLDDISNSSTDPGVLADSLIDRTAGLIEEVMKLPISGFGSDKFTEVLNSLDKFFKEKGRLSHGSALGRSVPEGKKAASQSVPIKVPSHYGNDNVSAVFAQRMEGHTVLSKAFLDVASSGIMQDCLRELKKCFRKEARTKQSSGLGAGLRNAQRRVGSSHTSGHYLTVPEQTCRRKRGFCSEVYVEFGCGSPLSEQATENCPQIIVTEAASCVAAGNDAQEPSTCLEIKSPSRVCTSITRGGGI